MMNKINRKIARLIPSVPFKLKSDRAVVSFTFDDFPESAAKAGKDALQSAGMTGTFFLSGKYSGDKLDNTHIASRQNIRDLFDGGHEIGCHTHGHLDCQKTHRKQLDEDLNQNQTFIKDITGQAPVSFAYPYGNMDMSTKKLIMKSYRVARGIDPGLNTGWSDLSNLKANAIYSHTFSKEAISFLIEKAVKDKSWLIFYSHDICDNPEAYGCTQRQLIDVINIVKQSNSLVLPIKHALAHFAFYGQR